MQRFVKILTRAGNIFQCYLLLVQGYANTALIFLFYALENYRICDMSVILSHDCSRN